MTLDAWCSAVGYSQTDIDNMLLRYPGYTHDRILSILIEQYISLYMNDAEVCFALACAGQNAEQNARGFLMFLIRTKPSSVTSKQAMLKALYTPEYKLYSKLFPKILECALIFDDTLFNNIYHILNSLRSNKTLDSGLTEVDRLVVYESILDTIIDSECDTSK